MSDQGTPDLSEGERVQVEAFGLDQQPDFAEFAERVAIRAAHIAELARDLLTAVNS